MAAARERRRVTRKCRNTFIEGRTSLRGTQHCNKFWAYVKNRKKTGGAGGDDVVVASRYRPDRGQGEGGGGHRQGRGVTVAAEKRKTSDLGKRQRNYNVAKLTK